MNESNQKQLGKILWDIADTLRGAMSADDFRLYRESRGYDSQPSLASSEE